MPKYLAPGVYVQNGNAAPRPPIDDVSTSTSGFVGETERGPTRPALVTSWSDYLWMFGGYIDQPPLNAVNRNLPYAVRGFFDNGGRRLYVARVAGAGAATAAGDLAGGAGPTAIEAVGPGTWGNRLRISVRAASASSPFVPGSPSPDAHCFRILVIYYRDAVPNPFVDPTDAAQLANPARREPDAFEDFDGLSADPTQPNYVMTVINTGSQLIRVRACPSPPRPVAFDAGLLLRTPGADAEADIDAYIGDAADPESRTGIEGLLTIREISLMAAPDEATVPALTDALLDRCERVKDRFAVLNETTHGTSVETIVQHRDSAYGAIYYPRIRVIAPHTPEGDALVPPCGHVTGIYARTDLERGVHKAPANEVVRGIVGIDPNGGRKPLEHTLNNREQDVLNAHGVNVIRDFRGAGRDIRVWGARTMASDPVWKYVNVRRLLIFIEQSIDQGAQWAVFEPNSDPTWAALRTSIDTFLLQLWHKGALMGRVAQEAFFVRCDRTTMTQDDVDNGRLICLVGVAPVRPAEFVIVRISRQMIAA